MTEQERELAELAIVANPASSDVALLPNLTWVHSVWAGVEGMMAELAHMPFDIVRLVDPNLGQTMSEAVLAWGDVSAPRYAGAIELNRCGLIGNSNLILSPLIARL